MIKVRKRSLKYEKPNQLKKKRYSFLTIALVICIFILSYSAFLNIEKIISYQFQIRKLKKIQTETLAKNQSLKKQLSDLNSRSYEAIARNNLKMAGEDEVLIIIQEPEQPKKKSIFHKDKKDKK